MRSIGSRRSIVKNIARQEPTAGRRSGGGESGVPASPGCESGTGVAESHRLVLEIAEERGLIAHVRVGGA
ncbi:MAG TPA: hypothetical protein VEI94_11905, partial [Candidatus Bathyarchaeia archaeon]|nr:hypothetical protein [Candidatus Bathyarchaeia archaeon]